MFPFLAIYDNETVPNNRMLIFSPQNIAKVPKFCPIWSRWALPTLIELFLFRIRNAQSLIEVWRIGLRAD